MAKERTSVRMQTQIKILSEQGHSIRSIARILRLSRRTVRKFLEPSPQPAGEGGGALRRLLTRKSEAAVTDQLCSDRSTQGDSSTSPLGAGSPWTIARCSAATASSARRWPTAR